ncbi:MAG: alpha-amylase family glycosyl hydrolase [Treponema sp.]
MKFKFFAFFMGMLFMSSILVAKSSVDIDKDFYYGSGDLGLSLTDSAAVFKCWAPLAKSVKVLLFKDAENLLKPAKSLKMKKDSENPGVWILEANTEGFSYYQYEIANPGKKSRVCDIWGKAASVDSQASQIVDINKDKSAIPENLKFDTEWGTKDGYYNPFGENGKTSKSYTDAVIYEMHIRDWSRVEVSDSLGKFTQIGDGEKIISHLKDLGVTHVQILPSFEYAEKASNKMYNWGYNPFNYNVPETRYVQDGFKDGSQAVKEMRYMIGKLHENGISVIMDVVYNHTSGTGDASLYDLIVPGYFYRLNPDGTYSNGSGCGSEVATEHKMVRKFVVDSVKHWMLDYHINGFRFDLMGLHERDTMKEIYEECSKIDSNVMIYGEPWTGGKSKVKTGVSKSTVDLIVEDESVNGVGCFNDDFRDAIKGGVFNALEGGFVQGNSSRIMHIISGLQGSVRGRGGFTKKIGRGINYAECHDNHTLFDKLAITELNKNLNEDIFSLLSESQLENIKKEEKLAAALIFLAQGTPFINGGQEFMRTKRGNANSYMAPDIVNQIDISMKEKFSDVYNTYKALILFRKANKTEFGANENASAQIISPNVVKYVSGKFTVYFNSNSEPVSVSDSGKIIQINEKDGTYSVGKSVSVSSVPEKSFLIIQK